MRQGAMLQMPLVMTPVIENVETHWYVGRQEEAGMCLQMQCTGVNADLQCIDAGVHAAGSLYKLQLQTCRIQEQSCRSLAVC